MNGRKKIIIIMIVLFGLLMTTGVSTWIITSQVTFAPEFKPSVTLTPILDNSAPIEVNFNELTSGKAYSNLNAKALEKITNQSPEENAPSLTFQDADGNPVLLTYNEQYVCSQADYNVPVGFTIVYDDDGNSIYFDQDHSLPYAIGKDIIYFDTSLFLNTVYNGYSISFNTGGGDYIEMKKFEASEIDNTFEYDLQEEIGEINQDGYKFIGWKHNDEKITKVTKQTFENIGSTNITLVAEWEKLAKLDVTNNIEHANLIIKVDGLEFTDDYVSVGQFVTVEISPAENYTLNNDVECTINGKTGEYEVQNEDINNGIKIVANGTTTSSGGGGGCFAPGTLITLADGRQVPIEQLTGDEMIMAFDHEIGQYVAAPLLIVGNRGDKVWTAMDLEFSDGTKVTILNERAFFDATLNRYVWINPNTINDFVGHEFLQETADRNGFNRVTLESVKVEDRFTSCYTIVSIYHFNCFGNGMMSVPGSIEGIFNYFEYDEDFKYDEEKKQADIEKYGLFEAADFANEMSKVIFEQLFPVKYMKIAIGKGNVTREEISIIIKNWIEGENLADKFSVT